MGKKRYSLGYGEHCVECGKKLGKYRLDGYVNGKSVGFCSSKCCDSYRDKNEKPHSGL